ncbi:acetylglutamate kinase [Salimicrobium salexigens]|nr:acetylglutamate kinase [Salimicrobium salexigens]
MSKSMPVTGHKPLLVLKIGGSMIEELESIFLKSVEELRDRYQFVIVHGAGPSISYELKKRKIDAPFIHGLRRTTKPAMEVVETVLGEVKNRELADRFTDEGMKAVGIRGCDDVISAEFLDFSSYGYVGGAPRIETGLLKETLERSFLPVVSPLAQTENGEIVNVNADTAAAGIAKALKADKLIFVTDVPGVMEEGRIIPHLSSADIRQLIEKETIYGGMIPKVRAAEEALSETLREAVIVSGKEPMSINGEWKGTFITKEGKGMFL